MRVTLLGTGSPIPTLERAGTCLAVDAGGEPVLVDCGPGAVHRMVEHGVHPGGVETLFLTHGHLDHTADLFHFLVASWSLGREALTVYGPGGTGAFVDALYDLYAEDVDYRKRFYPPEGIEGIGFIEVDAGFELDAGAWRATAAPVEHPIETYAYRFEEPGTGASFVFSGDTRPFDGLAEFADGADLLVCDCCVAPAGGPRPDRGLVWERLTEPMTDGQRAELSKGHCDPHDAGEVAAKAGVDRLVLTHLLPYRDAEAIRREAEAAFDGEVLVAEDGLAVEV